MPVTLADTLLVLEQGVRDPSIRRETSPVKALADSEGNAAFPQTMTNAARITRPQPHGRFFPPANKFD